MHMITSMAEKLTKTDPLQVLEESLDTELFKVLSEPARVELMKLLLRMPNADIGSIAARMSQDRSVVSRHLKAMLQAGLVSCRKEGKYCCYCLNGSVLIERFERILLLMKEAMANSDCC